MFEDTAKELALLMPPGLMLCPEDPRGDDLIDLNEHRFWKAMPRVIKAKRRELKAMQWSGTGAEHMQAAWGLWDEKTGTRSGVKALYDIVYQHQRPGTSILPPFKATIHSGSWPLMAVLLPTTLQFTQKFHVDPPTR